MGGGLEQTSDGLKSSGLFEKEKGPGSRTSGRNKRLGESNEIMSMSLSFESAMEELRRRITG